MQQLDAADSLFLSLERPECPMNMGLLVRLKPQDPDCSLETLSRLLEVGTMKGRRHHERLMPAPLGFDHAYWIHDSPVNLQQHFFRHELPAPGQQSQLHELVERILMTPLDRRRPLFENHLISGLEDGTVAVIFKLHHACADGLSAVRLFTETVVDPEQPHDNYPMESMRGKHLGWLTTWRMIRNPLRLLTMLLGNTALRLFVLTRGNKSGSRDATQVTRFTGPIGDHRNYGTLSFPLSRTRLITRHFSASENELLLTLYSGALRKYLMARAELPERSLHIGMPISMLFSTERKGASNQAGFLRVTLGTRISDPAERLQTMKKRTAKSLENVSRNISQRILDMLINTTPGTISRMAQTYTRLLRQGRVQPTLSAVCTYMPGPVRKVSIAGYQIESVYPMGVLYHGCGLSLSAMRYGGGIHCGVAADRDMLDSPEEFVGYLQEEFDLLWNIAEKAKAS